ncbi:hypothetical protein P280DRAFT_115373 [Massarina eburnea CBS 473.64]|uniref:Uncharacterized protein n=1 Tax=Massarina eburnea CBS 473.64 TaxID=1395130 RepID=A0A6A6SDA2_9PLEO|nr:hypothetical protein P280DRAFT_115373 [Massarina eburnea CBS 473.64]
MYSYRDRLGTSVGIVLFRFGLIQVFSLYKRLCLLSLRQDTHTLIFFSDSDSDTQIPSLKSSMASKAIVAIHFYIITSTSTHLHAYTQKTSSQSSYNERTYQQAAPNNQSIHASQQPGLVRPQHRGESFQIAGKHTLSRHACIPLVLFPHN